MKLLWNKLNDIDYNNIFKYTELYYLIIGSHYNIIVLNTHHIRKRQVDILNLLLTNKYIAFSK